MTGLYTDLMIGLLAIALGYATLRYNLGRYIIFVNEKKYDNKKVAKVAGTHIMAYGFISIILLVGRYFTIGNKVGDALNKASIAVLFIIGAIMYYNIRKSCKIEKKEEPEIKGINKKKKKKKKKKRK
ncbi:hypothetical protein [Terrisporobacter mayombei]|uniref:DUF3784 domain-containing protein n=1 Tax=Terrisporobacter mayombei TaxID=1541 RepID=A0ABY9Q617_9FIRM|nr:hypothetical protein [Terrisporobacter mayombei]MCC3869625.1 hypothetical protein [Terrisporobacter mayombei]WMT83436.1 hypothetical protein TEMA_39520 [Terrisporobacter mayombei]